MYKSQCKIGMSSSIVGKYLKHLTLGVGQRQRQRQRQLTVCEKWTKNLGRALPPHLDKIQKNSYFFFVKPSLTQSIGFEISSVAGIEFISAFRCTLIQSLMDFCKCYVNSKVLGK